MRFFFEALIFKQEIATTIPHATMYVGWSKGWTVFRMVKEIWNIRFMTLLPTIYKSGFIKL